LLRLKPNNVQQIFLDEIGYVECGTLEARRDIVLKARQHGMSTLILAMLYAETVNNPHTYTAVFSQDQLSTERLFQIVKRYHDNCPEHKKKQAKYESKQEFYWPSIDSYFFVGTAGAKQKAGRGGTINLVHCSEVAFWDNAEDLVAGLLETVPESGNIFVETTANGVGTWFYEEYQRAEQQKSEFQAHFYGWNLSEEYRISKPTDDEIPKTKEEITLVNKYGLDDEQILWRRNKVLRLKDQFPQEHPINADEAFLSSGLNYFNMLKLAEATPHCRPASEIPVPARYPNLKRISQQASETDRLSAKNAPNEELCIYQAPVHGKRYVISADPAEGIRDEGDHDYCSTDVLDYETWQQVAHLHGRWETHVYGALLAELYRWYNNGMLLVERNNHGHSVINTLLNVEDIPRFGAMEFGGLYFHEEYDGSTKKRTAKPGWPENPKTKIQLLNNLATAIDDDTVRVYNKDTLRELKLFSKLPNGKFGPEGHNHDDRVISLGLAVCGCLVTFKEKTASKSRIVRRGGYV
jgi:hypothetical protein